MVRKKKIRTKGKLPLSKYFQNLKEGERVSVVRELSSDSNFPERLQGRTGIVEGKQGREYMVKIMDHNKEKKFIIKPIHLKRVK